MCNEKSGGISLDFINSPKSRPILVFTPYLLLCNKFSCYSCSQKLQLLHSPSTLLLLKQKNCCTQGCYLRQNLRSFSFHLQVLSKSFESVPGLKKLCLHPLLKNFKLFSSLSLCSSEHGTFGKTTGVQLLLLPA